MLKKRIAAIIVIVVLVGAAIGMPIVINYYNDKSLINKIKYVESKDISVFSVDDKQGIVSNLKILNEQLYGDVRLGTVELNFEPSEDKINEIYGKIENEISLWFNEDIMALEAAGIDVYSLSDFIIETVRLYSIDKVTYFQVDAVLAKNPETLIRIAIDSEYYKIYSVNIYGKMVKKFINLYEDDTVGVVNAYESEMTKVIADKISKYYGIDVPKIKKNSESGGILKSVTYGLLSDLEWRIEFYVDVSPGIAIGIVDL